MNCRLLALALALPLLARPDIADDIKGQLSPFKVLRGHFEQLKSIPILKKPLKSRGDFVLLRDKGVLWVTTYPMQSTLKVTPIEIAQIKDGKISFRVKAQDQPALKLLGQVLFAVFAADVGELKRHFDISGSAVEGSWLATLKPKEPWMAKVASEIRLSGGRTLQSLKISEANGDTTSIRFSSVQLNTDLRGSEKALFE